MKNFVHCLSLCFLLLWGNLLLSSQVWARRPASFPPLNPMTELNPQLILYPKNSQKTWHLDAMNVSEAWAITKGSSSTIIAVIDSGVNYNDPEIRPSLYINLNEIPLNDLDDDNNGFKDDIFGWNFNEGGALPYDDNGHGTFVSSLIVAQGLKPKSGLGVCPMCSLMSLRFLDADGAGDDADLVKSVRYAIKNGARVINISTAGEGSDPNLLRALKEARDNDILVVVASGNDGESNDKNHIYPANHQLDNLMTVGSSTKNGKWWTDANYSPTKVHVAAPGEDLWGAWSDGKWYTGSGTSFSAPLVAGVAGLMRSADPTLTAPQVKEILIKTSSYIASFEGKCLASGIVDAGRAVACAYDPQHHCLN